MTLQLPESYLKFDYGLRPSKQVERKLIVALIQTLGQTVPVINPQQYTYVGFGSPYYIDFLLFHKYLGISEMICVEAAPIPKRMAFNKPYDFIQLHMSRLSDVLPTLDREACHLVWLDYDTSPSSEHLHDIESVVGLLAPGSFFMITLDAEVRVPEDLDDPGLSLDAKLKLTRDRYREEFSRYIGEEIELHDVTPNSLPILFAKVVTNCWDEACRTRGDVTLTPLLNFRYADGAQMVSLGGILTDPVLAKAVDESAARELPFVNAGSEPTPISVPPLTIREKLWLEQNLQAGATAFELNEDLLANFRAYYRYYPQYMETLI